NPLESSSPAEAGEWAEGLSARLDRLWPSATAASRANSLQLVGMQLGRYEVLSPLGKGAFGIVYLARDTTGDCEVAIKVPRPEVLVDSDFLDRFHSEASTAALLDHPAISRILEADFEGPIPYIASAYCAGRDMAHWIASLASPPASLEAAALMQQVAEAVHYAHERGVIHRDLKPSNILLEPVDHDSPSPQRALRPRITDFGLAKLVENSRQDTRSSLLIGTPLYMAPEQLAANYVEASRSVDIYALGAILFELLTLRPVYRNESYIALLDEIRNASPVRVCQLAPEIPPPLQAIIERCLEKDPEDRYDSAGALVEDLLSYQRGEPLHMTRKSPLADLLRWSRRPERLVTAGRFTCFYQLLIIVWIVSVATAGILSGAFVADTLSRCIKDVALVIFTFHGPLAWFGWRLAKSRRYAFLPVLFGSVLFTVLLFHASFTKSGLFEYNYPTTLSKITAYVALILGSLLQSLLAFAAVPAWRRLRRRGAGGRKTPVVRR
ncbi:MAG: serine/threonine protein kinase, partial [Planctomycetales bacterium]|nr:serine/threonine protein kinase [Planctomycetales bacterium]